jgi:hypothetical protein
LDASSAEFFRALRLRLISRGGIVVGRYGRTASVNGVLTGLVLHAVWRDEKRRGWLTVVFADGFRSFKGHFGVGAASHPISGTLDARVSERDTKSSS